jgi:hypothetical protein
MKTAYTLALCAATVILLFTAAYMDRRVASKPITPTITNKGFALLELFTSEGCSSCPPADKLLSRIRETVGDKPVYILAYHVDYWNRLGWRDRFSNPQFSTRQRLYSEWLGTHQIYTPQVVINGMWEGVGSNEPALYNAIQDALNKPAANVLTLQASQQDNGIFVKYQLDGDTQDRHLLIAIVQKHAVTDIKRGENTGRTLEHTAIVHTLQSFDVPHSNQGIEKLHPPVDFNTQEWEVIGFIQHAKSGEVTAAARTVFQ